MGLRGQFSNLSHPLSGLLSHSLTGLKEDQDLPQIETTPGWPDGRRAFATVSSAIVNALAHGQEMSVKAIRSVVEDELGGPVSRFSVSDYLLTRSKGPNPVFVRTRHGYYRLLVHER